MLRLFRQPCRRKSRGHAGSFVAEALEQRILPFDLTLRSFEGIHEVEVVGRAANGNWWATGFDIDPDDHSTFSQDTELFARWSTAIDWRHVRFGDYDGDGLQDIAGWDPRTGNWWASMADGVGSTTFLAGKWAAGTTWNDVAAVDLAGAGDRGDQGHFTHKFDLVGRASNGQWWAAVSNGDGTFTNKLLTSWTASAGWRDVKFLDVNKDGETDILGRTSGGQWWAAVNQGGLSFRNTYIGAWPESAGWKDVTVVYDFFSDLRYAVLGRANDGTWWTLRFTASGTVVGPVGKWAPTAGWRDVGDIGGAIVGRTASGQWWKLFYSSFGGVKSESIGAWDESAGWRDVRTFYGGILARNAAGEWWVRIPQFDITTGWHTGSNWVQNRVATWTPGTTWRDVTVAHVTEALITVETFDDVIMSWPETTIRVRGHRKGTSVTVEDALDGDGHDVLKITLSVPATGYVREVLVHPDFVVSVKFDGHRGADEFVNRSTKISSYAHGWAGDDKLDGANGIHDELFGGDGLDVLLGDPGDKLMQDI